jgi:hypothetical protein
MKLVKLKNVAIPSLPDNEEPYASRPIPKQGIPLHHLCACIGGTGSGKTTKMLEFLNWYDKAGAFDRLIIFSPTADKDAKMKRYITDEHNFEVSYYPQYTDTIMREEVASMEADIEEWRQFLKQKEAYKKYLRVKDVDELDLDDLEALYSIDFEKPQWKYKKEHYPSFAIVIDDHVGKKGVFGANCTGYLSEVCVVHRHISLSVYLLSQVFTNFIPKQYRGGIINMWILFSTKSQKHKESIAEQVANKVDTETFLKVWDYATKDSPHDCLVVDYKAPSIDYMFRKGFDKLIQLNDEKDLSHVDITQDSNDDPKQ